MDFNIELKPLKIGATLSARSQQTRDIIQDGVVSELKDYLSENNNLKAINNLDEDGLSLLHISSRWNRAEMAQMLIDRGAQLDNRMKDGSTPLHVAAR